MWLCSTTMWSTVSSQGRRRHVQRQLTGRQERTCPASAHKTTGEDMSRIQGEHGVPVPHCQKALNPGHSPQRWTLPSILDTPLNPGHSPPPWTLPSTLDTPLRQTAQQGGRTRRHCRVCQTTTRRPQLRKATKYMCVCPVMSEVHVCVSPVMSEVHVCPL